MVIRHDIKMHQLYIANIENQNAIGVAISKQSLKCINVYQFIAIQFVYLLI